MEQARLLAPQHEETRQLLDQLAGRPYVAASLDDPEPAALAQRREAAARRQANRIRMLVTKRAGVEPVTRYTGPAAPKERAGASPMPNGEEWAPLPEGVRAPWPDELPRLAAAFPQLRFVAKQAAVFPLVLVEGDSPERLVGVAGIFGANGEAGGTLAGLTFFLRPRYHATPTADRFFAAIRQVARSLGVRTLAAADDLREGDAQVAELQRAGFVISRTDEIWGMAVADLVPRLRRLQDRFAAAGRLEGFRAIALADADLEAVRTLVTAERLLAAEDITVRAGPAATGNYDGLLSTVVLRDGEVIAAMLARRMGRTGVVEARVVAPRWRGGYNLPNHLLLHRSMEAGQAEGMEHAVFTGDTVHATETIQMAQRFGGRRIDRKLRLKLDLA